MEIVRIGDKSVMLAMVWWVAAVMWSEIAVDWWWKKGPGVGF